METYDAILERMVETYEEESGARVEDVSEIGLRLRVLAGELFRLETSLDWLERQAFPQTATGKQLDLHGAMQGVFRKPAEQAKGTVTFSRYLPLTFDLVVPQGTVCATSGESAPGWCPLPPPSTSSPPSIAWALPGSSKSLSAGTW